MKNWTGTQRIIALAHLIWLALICVLGAWWGRVVLSQAKRIADLEHSLGLSSQLTQGQWHKTERMLFWESFTFFGLLFLAAAFIFWLYWRDLKRTRGLQTFFAAVAHELRTPLASIRLQAESISDSFLNRSQYASLPSEKTRIILDRLLEDTFRLEDQVAKTLELARVEGGGPVSTQPLPIQVWVERFLKVWTAQNFRQVEFKTHLEPCLVLADPAALQVIFRNLIENSIRHSQMDPVTISITAKPLASPLPKVQLIFRDYGRGFLGDQKYLGQLFHKGEASSSTGVGLYLIKLLVNKMKGSVSFSSAAGFQAHFTFLGANAYE